MVQTLFVTSLIVAITALLVGLAKGGLGNAIGSLATPLLTLAMPAAQTIGLSLPILLIGDAFAIYSHRGKWDLKLVLRALPGSIVGLLVGYLLLNSLKSQSRTFEVIIGIFSLLFCAYKLSEPWIRKTLSRAGEESHGNVHPLITPIFTFATGLGSTLANQGGPVFSAYLLILNLRPEIFAATAALYFGILNVLKIPIYLQNGILRLDQIQQYFWVIPIVFIGVRIGYWADQRIDKVTFERITLGALVIVGVFLLVK